MLAVDIFPQIRIFLMAILIISVFIAFMVIGIIVARRLYMGRSKQKIDLKKHDK